ncbi:transposase DNA-binding-containing protein [Noviherbaspirillum suwonense]|uniref:transposase DNA-binding-containing protein n=1 Tax=Noviherbaspirillum suwonense TaxID=1224511 RepID=UPI0024B7AFCA|nr:transposase DNA-binding-containing protein [Noviherbaspirillum suwonense]
MGLLQEFKVRDLGDPRRDQHAKELLTLLAAKPSESIPGACDGGPPHWYLVTRKMAGYVFKSL